MNVIFKWLTTNVEWTPFSYIKAIFKPRLQTHRAINPEKKKSQFGKVTFQKSQTLNLPERLKSIVFFKKNFQTDGPFCTIFPFLAHYGIFMISSILHVTWNYILLILCASLSLYTLLTWRKKLLLSIGLMGRPYLPWPLNCLSSKSKSQIPYEEPDVQQKYYFQWLIDPAIKASLTEDFSCKAKSWRSQYF